MQVPPKLVAKIIGSKGANIKKCESTYGVKINAPSKQECNSGAAFVIVTITQLQAASNMQGAIQFIQSKAPGATPAGGGGAAAAGGGLFGGGAAGGGGGAAAGNTCIFMFRNNPQDNQLQVCLQQQGHGWDVPSCNGSHHQHLTQSCVGNNPQIPFASCPAVPGFEAVPFNGKTLVHMAVPPEQSWNQVWTGQQAAGPTVNGAPQQIWTAGTSQVCWVNVGVVQATRGQTSLGSLSMWLNSNCDGAVIPKLSALYAGAPGTAQVTAVAVAPVVGSPGFGGAGAASPGAAPAVPGWAKTPQGQKYAANLQAICKSMAGFDSNTFLQAMEAAFTPGDLQQVFKKWGAIQPLPHGSI